MLAWSVGFGNENEPPPKRGFVVEGVADNEAVAVALFVFDAPNKLGAGVDAPLAPAPPKKLEPPGAEELAKMEPAGLFAILLLLVVDKSKKRFTNQYYQKCSQHP